MEYCLIEGPDISDALLEGCSQLFSQHYGVWSSAAATPTHCGGKAGSPVEMSAQQMRVQLLFDETCGVAVCLSNGLPVGQAFFCTFTLPALHDDDGSRNVCWITQLVVHADRRRQGIAVKLLSLVVDSRARDCVAVGVASCNPTTVRAVERVAGGVSEVDEGLVREVFSHCSVPHLKRATDLVVSECECAVNTNFFVDHLEGLFMLEKLKCQWVLGVVREGWEYLSIVRLSNLPESEEVNG
ncbi:hypothetical protein BV898_09888 [Hypsibius exemplaris]|uniref:N-acetyltransferase domain-containing protein n=1 Tax=Hypsibius exemplaris TaxID=2072580 RepID=A0A1W0WLC9_HYPEX|nr:hypothetical protein BV898_09888 [Hypsibius exemplaris]